MFNNINDNNPFLKAQLESQNNVVNLALMRMNQTKSSAVNKNDLYVDSSEISSNAIKLFQKDCDIKKFNKIAMSDPDDLSHLEIMKELFANGVIDAYEDDIIPEVADSLKLWNDLEL